MKVNRMLNHGAAVCAMAMVWTGCALADPVAGQGTWESTLRARDINGDGTADAFYDTTLKITWLADARAGAGSVHDDGASGIDGEMSWANAVAWAGQLNVFGVSGWRLPTLIDTAVPGCDYSYAGGTDCGYNVLRHLSRWSSRLQQTCPSLSCHPWQFFDVLRW